jgi:asparagine synthase (glutamine-hydrolysing)
VELRVPLLDFQILEFAASLPPRFKVHGWVTKCLLKAALEECVPREIIKRKKTGFRLPYERWLRKELKEFVFGTVLSMNAALASYFSTDKVRELPQIHQKGESCSQEVFCPIVLELWHKAFNKAAFPS